MPQQQPLYPNNNINNMPHPSQIQPLTQMKEQQVSLDEMARKYSNDQDTLCQDHEKLIEQILEEEESLISSHRHHIDDVVDLVKQEMMLLHEVD